MSSCVAKTLTHMVMSGVLSDVLLIASGVVVEPGLIASSKGALE